MHLKFRYTFIIVLFVGVVSWYLGSWSVENFAEPLHTLYKWQSFYGALIAALVALLIFGLTEWYKFYRGRLDHLHFLHHSLAAALVNLAEIDIAIDKFAQDRVMTLLKKIEEDIQNDQPSIGQAFVPLLHVFDISEKLLERFSGSGYVDYLTIDLINKSKDFRKIIDDINRQFENTLLMNTQILLSRVNQNPTAGNNAFRQNISNFKSQMIEQDFRKNIRVYAAKLVEAQVAVRKLKEWGVVKWQHVFKKVKPDDIVPTISAYFRPEVEERLIKVQPSFKTELKISVLDGY